MFVHVNRRPGTEDAQLTVALNYQRQTTKMTIYIYMYECPNVVDTQTTISFTRFWC